MFCVPTRSEPKQSKVLGSQRCVVQDRRADAPPKKKGAATNNGRTRTAVVPPKSNYALHDESQMVVIIEWYDHSIQDSLGSVIPKLRRDEPR